MPSTDDDARRPMAAAHDGQRRRAAARVATAATMTARSERAARPARPGACRGGSPRNRRRRRRRARRPPWRWRWPARRRRATATGSEDAKDGRQRAGRPEPAEDRQQRDPDRERQPRPGRALGDEVVAVADRQDDDRQSQGRRAGRDGEQRAPAWPRRPCTARAIPGGDEAGRDRLAGLAARVARRVDEVVERPDRDLQGGHRDAEADGRRRVARRRSARPRRPRAPSRRDGKRVGQPDQATQSRRVGPAGCARRGQT